MASIVRLELIGAGAERALPQTGKSRLDAMRLDLGTCLD